MLLCLLPSVGSLSYLMSRPMRRNHLLVRVTADAMLSKLPFHIYGRTHLRRLIAHPATVPAATAKADRDGSALAPALSASPQGGQPAAVGSSDS
jgi:hypothetical protein